MNIKHFVDEWFERWVTGDIDKLPISPGFKHTSPFGTIDGRDAYLKLVEENRDKFLGYRFERHDGIYEKNRACVRYTAIQGDFVLDVSEWFYSDGEAIDEIIAHYHIGDIREERQLD
ncbi:MAG: nuclear transport factor 2 family protein [Rhodothermales bacterium]|nr:nuclear transport factor 2 family protein [Rhodothermales bacterium]